MAVDSPVAPSVATEVPATSSGAAEVYTPLSSRTTAASFSQIIPVLQHGKVEHKYRLTCSITGSCLVHFTTQGNLLMYGR